MRNEGDIAAKLRQATIGDEVGAAQTPEPVVHVTPLFGNTLLCGASLASEVEAGAQITFMWHKCACKGCSEHIVRELCKRWGIGA